MRKEVLDNIFVRCFYYVTNNTKDYNKIKNIKVINSKKVRNID